MDRFTWYLSQLFPRTYWSVYGNAEQRTTFCIWKMWLGRCYDVMEIDLGTPYAA